MFVFLARIKHAHHYMYTACTTTHRMRKCFALFAIWCGSAHRHTQQPARANPLHTHTDTIVNGNLALRND